MELHSAAHQGSYAHCKNKLKFEMGLWGEGMQELVSSGQTGLRFGLWAPERCMQAWVIPAELLLRHPVIPLVEINAGGALRTETSRHFVYLSCDGIFNVRLDNSSLVLPSAPESSGFIWSHPVFKMCQPWHLVLGLLSAWTDQGGTGSVSSQMWVQQLSSLDAGVSVAPYGSKAVLPSATPCPAPQSHRFAAWGEAHQVHSSFGTLSSDFYQTLYTTSASGRVVAFAELSGLFCLQQLLIYKWKF